MFNQRAAMIYKAQIQFDNIWRPVAVGERNEVALLGCVGDGGVFVAALTRVTSYTSASYTLAASSAYGRLNDTCSVSAARVMCTIACTTRRELTLSSRAIVCGWRSDKCSTPISSAYDRRAGADARLAPVNQRGVGRRNRIDLFATDPTGCRPRRVFVGRPARYDPYDRVRSIRATRPCSHVNLQWTR